MPRDDQRISPAAEMALDEGARPPAECTPLPQVGMPFDGGVNWPDLGDRLYTWTDDAVPAGAR